MNKWEQYEILKKKIVAKTSVEYEIQIKAIVKELSL